MHTNKLGFGGLASTARGKKIKIKKVTSYWKALGECSGGGGDATGSGAAGNVFTQKTSWTVKVSP